MPKIVRKTNKPDAHFRTALDVAKKSLASKMAEKGTAEARVTVLNIEIPALEATIRALTAQLTPGANLPAGPARISTPQTGYSPDHTAWQRPSPSLHEVDDSMTSVPASLALVENPDPNATPDLDDIPEFGGDFQ